MKKFLAMFAMLLIACSGVMARAAEGDHHRLDDRLDSARSVIDSIMSVPDKAIPDGIARHAKCIAVVPGVVKGAFIVGAVMPRIPMRRFGEPTDFGGIAVYLMSKASSYHTADCFVIDGGYTAF